MEFPYAMTLHPTAPVEERYELTLTLDSALLHALANPLAPLHHMLPINRFRTDWDALTPYLPSSDSAETAAAYEFASAIADIKPVPLTTMINLDGWLFRPFLAQLAAHPQFGFATSSWRSPHLAPPVHPEWIIKDDLQHTLASGLVPFVNALLQFLPHQVALVSGDSELIPDSWTSIKSDLYCIYQPTQGDLGTAGVQCLFVVQLMHDVDRQGVAQLIGNPRLSYGHVLSSLGRMKWERTSRLAAQMASSNAIFGLLYNGAELIVYQRDFEHDRQHRLLVAQYVPQLRGAMPPPGLLPLEPTMLLHVWSLGFGHPQDPLPPTPFLRRDNPALVFSALASYAFKKWQLRNEHYPELVTFSVSHLGLGAARFPNGIQQFPRVRPTDEERDDPVAPTREEDVSSPTSEIACFCPADTHVLKPIDLLQVVTASGGTSLYRHISEDDEPWEDTLRLVASGRTSDNETYLLICPLSMAKKGRSACVFPGTLTVFGRECAPAHLEWTTAVAGQARPLDHHRSCQCLDLCRPYRLDFTQPRGGMPARRDKPNPFDAMQAPCVADRLYIVAGNVASKIALAETSSACPPLRRTSIVIKLPNFPYPLGEGDIDLDGYDYEVEEERWQESCALDMPDWALHEDIAVRHRRVSEEDSIVALLSRQAGESHGSQQGPYFSSHPPVPAPLLEIRLSCGLDGDQLASTYPELSSLLNRPLPVTLEQGATIDELLRVLDFGRGRWRKRRYPLSSATIRLCRRVLAFLESAPDPQLALRMLRAEGEEKLQRVHERGVIHRDIHSGNVCISVLDQQVQGRWSRTADATAAPPPPALQKLSISIIDFGDSMCQALDVRSIGCSPHDELARLRTNDVECFKRTFDRLVAGIDAAKAQ